MFICFNSVAVGHKLDRYIPGNDRKIFSILHTLTKCALCTLVLLALITMYAMLSVFLLYNFL